jgi:hypothetical protein
MPPRLKDSTKAWPKRVDGTPVNPNSTEGMLISGVVVPEPQGMPWRKPYEETLEPANAAAILASTPQADDGSAVLWKEPPPGVDFFRVHLADEEFPEVPPMLGCVCSSDQLEDVLECMMGSNEQPRYRNPTTGLEFEWTSAPANFYGPAAGNWGVPRMAEELEKKEVAELDDKE